MMVKLKTETVATFVLIEKLKLEHPSASFNSLGCTRSLLGPSYLVKQTSQHPTLDLEYRSLKPLFILKLA